MTALVYCPNPNCKHGQYVDDNPSEMNPVVGVWCDRCHTHYNYCPSTGKVTLATPLSVILGWFLAIALIAGLACWVASWYIPGPVATMTK